MVSSDLTSCSFCGHLVPPPAERCPHCAQPGLFPNVRAAARDAETTALDDRYKAAKQDALTRHVDGIVEDFERAVTKAGVSMTRPLLELQRLASNENELYASYYELTEAGVKLPKGEQWDALREVTDSALFTGYRKHIKFAALTLDGCGLSNYGDCALFLRELMIAHRASAFEENSVLFMIHKNIRFAEASQLPPGFRSTWGDRGKLCVAKLAPHITPGIIPANYPELLMKQGATSADDAFVEIHVWGPLTIHSLEKVTLFPRPTASSALTVANKEKLQKADVAITETKS